MRIGLISGTGSYAWPGLVDHTSRTVTTDFGDVELSEGQLAGVEVVHLCRHGNGHARLSNQVNHRANLAALIEVKVDAVVAMTVCGAVDPAIRLGSVVVFDDLYFPGNRLPDGSACTWHVTPGAPGRGHWIFDQPFSNLLRQALIQAAAATDIPCHPAGCYGHVDGPRFNTGSEIAALAAVGVAAVSQTLGPEVVLAGEAELPIAALGYVTDYANGVSTDAEPLEGLAARFQQAPRTFAAVIAAALPAVEKPSPAGSVWGFD